MIVASIAAHGFTDAVGVVWVGRRAIQGPPRMVNRFAAVPVSEPMANYRGTISTSRSQADAFAYMADFANVRAWDPTAVEARALGDGEPALGSRFFVRVRWLGREVPLTYEITEFEPPGRLVLRAENATSVSEDTVTVGAAEEGAVLTYEARVVLKGPARLLDPVLGLAFGRLGDSAAAGLRRELGGASR